MPASSERVPNSPLSGHELVEIIKKDVADILGRDGLFTSNIAFPRVSYEVRVSVHMDNPMCPKHETVIQSRIASKQQVAANPELASIETPPLAEPLTESETVFSEETTRQVASPNMARIEAGLPIQIDKRNPDTGFMERKDIKYTGDVPEPSSVGNVSETNPTSEDQRQKWNRPRKGNK